MPTSVVAAVAYYAASQAAITLGATAFVAAITGAIKLGKKRA